MTGTPIDAAGRLRALLVPVIGGLVGLLLTLGLVEGVTTTGAAFAVLSLMFVAVAATALLGVALAVRSVVPITATRTGQHHVLRGRVTDPTHQPLRPRAPGLA
jgi:fumarate reductase subunit D